MTLALLYYLLTQRTRSIQVLVAFGAQPVFVALENHKQKHRCSHRQNENSLDISYHRISHEECVQDSESYPNHLD